MAKHTLYDRSDNEYKHLIGKKIQVIDKNGKKRVGVLDFVGVNTFLHNQFQVTLNRTPIWPIDPKTIKIYED